MKAYLDNDIVSAIAKSDFPPSEMKNLQEMLALVAAQKLEVVTSMKPWPLFLLFLVGCGDDNPPTAAIVVKRAWSVEENRFRANLSNHSPPENWATVEVKNGDPLDPKAKEWDCEFDNEPIEGDTVVSSKIPGRCHDTGHKVSVIRQSRTITQAGGQGKETGMTPLKH